jgi:hypothetical protein
MGALAPAYRPRRPTETVLYAVVREHLETFLAHARETYDAPLPLYVEQELRGYLRCGVFAHGFVRAHCDSCGHDLLVAFSCKARAVCPSCAGRRMANTAAHLVDRVLPAVPVRQWVLSLPFELRRLAAFRAGVLSALCRIFHESVFARYAAWAESEDLGRAPTGAVTHVQRFGSSVNLHVHFHSMVLDGVFSRDERGRAVFHPAPAPTRRELALVLERVHERAATWLQRRGLLGSTGESSQESPQQTSLDACAITAMQRGTVGALRDEPDGEHDVGGDASLEPADQEAVDHRGFNVHAGVRMAGDDDLGRERLMRYGARPPLALERLRRLPGGRIAYRIKKLRDGRAKHRIMTPLEFLARLAAIVPPPRFPLVRYAGVLGPRSPWRRDVTPSPRQEVKACPPASDDEPRGGVAKERRSPAPPATTPAAQSVVASVPIPTASINATLLSPNVLSVQHWSRLLGGSLYAATRRVDWASLLRRCFDVDVLACTTCGGRLRVLGEVTDASVVKLVLDALGLPSDAPRVARARDPTDLFDDDPV